MAPHWPEEVDVFSEPHSRMKKLVHKYSKMVSSTDFTDESHMKSLLQNLINVFCEFKAHEDIENILIMHNLKQKLEAARVTSAAVCNCHSDNRLTDMLEMVVRGYRSHWTEKSVKERKTYGYNLQKALEDFTENFIPHMEEEEEVFQPMLMNYFTYEELKELKLKVIKEHLQPKSQEKYIKNIYESEKTSQEESENEACYFDLLPVEMSLKIFSFLNPQDLGKAGQTCHKWNRLTKHRALWKGIYPVHWAMGNWTFYPESLGGVDGAGEFDEELMVDLDDVACHDEDADVDESSISHESKYDDDEGENDTRKIVQEGKLLSTLVKHLLPLAGSGVKVVDLAYCRGLNSSLVHKILKLCPNVEVLDLTHTQVGDAAFDEYGVSNRQSKLRRLDLTNCHQITDQTLFSLVGLSRKENDYIDMKGGVEKEVEIENASAACPKIQATCCRGKGRPNSTVSTVTKISRNEREKNVVSCSKKLNQVFASPVSGVCYGSTDRNDSTAVRVCPSHHVNRCSDTTSVSNPPEQYNPYSGVLNSEINDNVRSLSDEVNRVVHCQDTDCDSAPPNHSLDLSSSPFPPSCTTGFSEKSSNSDVDSSCDNKSPRHSKATAKPCCGPSSENLFTRNFDSDSDDSDNGDFVSSVTAKNVSISPLLCLEFLSLNGCYQISDQGLKALASAGGTPGLGHLDLSGCLALTGDGIHSLVSTCGPCLDHAMLFYCDNIQGDPYPATASGCRNLGCETRFCCSAD